MCKAREQHQASIHDQGKEKEDPSCLKLIMRFEVNQYSASSSRTCLFEPIILTPNSSLRSTFIIRNSSVPRVHVHAGDTSTPRRSILYMSVIPSVGCSIHHSLNASNADHSLPLRAKANLVGRSGVLRNLFGGQQLVGPKRHGQELLESHDRVLAVLVVHQDGSAGLFGTESVRETPSR
jgi:hypothetical protein